MQRLFAWLQLYIEMYNTLWGDQESLDLTVRCALNWTVFMNVPEPRSTISCVQSWMGSDKCPYGNICPCCWKYMSMEYSDLRRIMPWDVAPNSTVLEQSHIISYHLMKWKSTLTVGCALNELSLWIVPKPTSKHTMLVLFWLPAHICSTRLVVCPCVLNG